MRKKIIAALLAAVLSVSLLAACGGGAPKDGDAGSDQLAAILAKGEIVVAMEGTWSPWTYHDESGELVGYDTEVAQGIAERLGVKVTFAEGEFDGLLAGLDDGRYDMIVNGVDINPDRQEKYSFSDPYAYGRTAVIVRADNGDIQTMEDLAGKETANTITSTYAAVAQKYGANVTGVDDLNQTFELLFSGRIDATLNAEVSYYDYLRAHPDAEIKIACLDPEATQTAIPMRKGEESASLVEAVNGALADMAADGTLSALSEKYFGTDISKAS
ncbi:MAG: transporter substrate-binding domain-containing protein [Oscillospiraceae bacterium]|nr:transporter substrate-binding domain-containing protein [Oscillospiraceae bacterium]